VRFIEYMPMGKAPLVTGNRLLAPEIRKRLAPLGRLIPIERSRRDGPAERYRLENSVGEIGIIRPVSHHFCDTCNRLRLTASGQIRPCLLSSVQKDLRGPLRSGCSDDDLAGLIRSAAELKPGCHHLGDQAPGTIQDQMASIGG